MPVQLERGPDKARPLVNAYLLFMFVAATALMSVPCISTWLISSLLVTWRSQAPVRLTPVGSSRMVTTGLGAAELAHSRSRTSSCNTTQGTHKLSWTCMTGKTISSRVGQTLLPLDCGPHRLLTVCGLGTICYCVVVQRPLQSQQLVLQIQSEDKGLLLPNSHCMWCAPCGSPQS